MNLRSTAPRTMIAGGYIEPDSLVITRIFTPHTRKHKT